MTMKPILFNTEMVRALLDGRKSVTRLVVKPQPEFTPMKAFGRSYRIGARVVVNEPYHPGTILYVRETWFQFKNGGYAYAADSNERSEKIRKELGYKWRPSINMPKDAARLFLRVTDVRVERLNDMSEEDAIAEGFADSPAGTDSPLERFSVLWDKTIKREDLRKYGWDKSPWVWVIEFERISKEKALEAQKDGEYNG